MANTSNLKPDEDKFPVNTTGEPTEQFASANDDFDDPEGEEISDEDFDAAPMDDDEDLDDDEVKRIFPTEDEDLSDEDEPYEGIRHDDDDDDDLVDDNMTGMPVVPSPS